MSQDPSLPSLMMQSVAREVQFGLALHYPRSYTQVVLVAGEVLLESLP